MRVATAAMALNICACSLLFGDAPPAVSDAGSPDASLPACVSEYQYPDVPLGAHYVGGEFADDNNDGLTARTAWATFAASLPKLVGGDTLVVREGNYTEALNINVSGATDKRITIMAEGDGLAVIDGRRPTFHVQLTAHNSLT